MLRPPDTDANDKTILSKPEDEVNDITFQLMDNEIPGPCFFIDDLCDDAAEGLALRDLGLLKNKNHNNCSVSQSLQNIGRVGANKDVELEILKESRETKCIVGQDWTEQLRLKNKRPASTPDMCSFAKNA